MSQTGRFGHRTLVFCKKAAETVLFIIKILPIEVKANAVLSPFVAVKNNNQNYFSFLMQFTSFFLQKSLIVCCLLFGMHSLP